MKKIGLMFVLGFALLLAACGNMSEDDVIEKLTANLRDATSYMAEGMMTLESDGQRYEYAIQVAFQRDGFYRVTMRNETTNNEQIILRNDEGVFVLTPSLNKKFKFQSDWPLSSSQIYLYESLLSDILNDEGRVFTAGEESYIFETVANYHGNSDLVAQIVQFNSATLTPVSAEVKDSSGTVRMSMNFTKFEFNAAISEGFFDSEATMEQTTNTMATWEPVDIAETEWLPTFLPEGTTGLISRTPIDLEDGERVIMTWGGEQSFTIIQESLTRNEEWVITPITGELVLVGGVVGSLSDNTLTWVRDGIEFFLVSDTLTTDEMVSVASSISSEYVK